MNPSYWSCPDCGSIHIRMLTTHGATTAVAYCACEVCGHYFRVEGDGDDD